MPRAERIVPPPISREDVLIDLLIARVDPAFDGSGIHMRREAQRFVAWLPPPQSIGVGALPVRIEHAFVVPQPIEKGARLGELRVLPRQDLWLGPVKVEDLRLARFQRGKILIEAPLLDLSLFVAVGLDIFPDLREPVLSKACGKDPAYDHTAGFPDRPLRRIRNLAAADVGVGNLRYNEALRRGIGEYAVHRSPDVASDVGEGTPQGIAPRCHRALEADNSIADVACCIGHSSSMAAWKLYWFEARGSTGLWKNTIVNAAAKAAYTIASVTNVILEASFITPFTSASPPIAKCARLPTATGRP